MPEGPANYGLKLWEPIAGGEMYVLKEDTEDEILNSISNSLTKEEAKQYLSGERKVAGIEELQVRYYHGLPPAKKVVFAHRAKRFLESRKKQNSLFNRFGLGSDAKEHGITVYSEDECIGPVIMGECKGAILPKFGYHKKCYGTWLSGRCIGPQF